MLVCRTLKDHCLFRMQFRIKTTYKLVLVVGVILVGGMYLNKGDHNFLCPIGHGKFSMGPILGIKYLCHRSLLLNNHYKMVVTN